MAQAGIRLLTPGELSPEQKAHLSSYFAREVWPVLTPLAVDPGHPFPMLRNRSLNLAVFMHREKEKVARRETMVAVVQVPSVLPRFTEVPLPRRGDGGNGAGHPHPLRVHAARGPDRDARGRAVPGLPRARLQPVPRHAQLRPLDRRGRGRRPAQDDPEGAAPARAGQRGAAGDRARHAHRGAWRSCAQALRLETDDVYLFDGPLHLADLAPLGARDELREFRDEPFSPQIVPPLQEYDDIFRVIAQRDILLQHPYESFEDVVEFISEAADDPNVLAIKQTLYRTSADSPIVRALIRAAENGKQVTAVVELKARFDEAPNIQWARTLEDAGVHVVYGLIGLKTHCKVALVVRREGNRIKRYVHLSTGNYNPTHGARLRRPVLLHGARRLRRRRGRAVQPAHRLFVAAVVEAVRVAPLGLHDRIIALIEREAALGSRGRIIAKMNALVDAQVIKALYRASQAGVSIDLIVRGICCLRPGVPGHQREHPRHQHRRPLPGARAHLPLRQRRQARGLPVVGRLDAAQLPAPGRGDVPRRGRGPARSRDRRDPGDRAEGQRQGAPADVRRQLRPRASRAAAAGDSRPSAACAASTASWSWRAKRRRRVRRCPAPAARITCARPHRAHGPGAPRGTTGGAARDVVTTAPAGATHSPRRRSTNPRFRLIIAACVRLACSPPLMAVLARRRASPGVRLAGGRPRSPGDGQPRGPHRGRRRHRGHLRLGRRPRTHPVDMTSRGRALEGRRRPATRFTVVQLGGTVGDLTLVHGISHFSAGERALVFLRGTPQQAGVVGMAQGKRVIRRDAGTGEWIVVPRTARGGRSCVRRRRAARHRCSTCGPAR